MKNLPLVSIGLPTHNGDKYIALMLQSLANQTYPNIELIISNNNSTDNTLKICNLFKKKFNNIQIFTQKSTLCAVDNFNFVLEKATGEYFIWASDDDVFMPGIIKTLVKNLTKSPSRVAGVSPAFVVIDAQNKIHPLNSRIKLSIFPTEVTAILFLKIPMKAYKANFIYGLFRTSILKKIGGFQKYKYITVSDIHTLHKLLEKHEIIFLKNQTLFLKRQHYFADSLSHLSIAHKIIRFASQAVKNLLQNILYNFGSIMAACINYYKLVLPLLPNNNKSKLYLLGSAIELFFITIFNNAQVNSNNLRKN